MEGTSFKNSQKRLTICLLAIGLSICFIGTLVSSILNDFVITFIVGLTGVLLATAFLKFFKKEEYNKIFMFFAAELSILVFPGTMIFTNFPGQGILYQFTLPIVWALAICQKSKKYLIYPTISGLLIASIDFYKFLSLGLAQSIQYTAIYVVIYLFLFFMSYYYTKSTYEAYVHADKSLHIDYLTTAFNRFGITEYMKGLIERKEPFYLVYLDLDNFKNINDTLGHEKGDELLKAIVKYWWRHLWDVKGCVGRMGGDEFAVIIETDNKDYARSVVERAISGIDIINDETVYNVTFSAGMTSYPSDTTDTKELFSFADIAMYQAKSKGKNTYEMFTSGLRTNIVKEVATKDILENALKSDSFYLVYQPQLNVQENKLYGFEALLRLKNNKGMLFNTQYLIDVAEKTSLIYDIDKYVINRVLKEWKKLIKVNKELIISINVSGSHICRPNFVDFIKETLEKNKFPASNLCLEITESAFIESMKIAKENINILTEMGIKIALDDFGMGYSSLSYLRELPVHHIKLEKYFINNMLTNEYDSKLITSIISLGHSFNYQVIAEGVETKEQLDILNKKECDAIQGYIYSRPMEIKDIEKII